MRVVAGELRGRRLLAPRGHRVRPTSDRVREAIFSALGEVGGARVLDLYSGTGALAIEALSRGAGPATLVDRDTRAALGNVRNLGLDDRVELVRSDVLAWLQSQVTSNEQLATSNSNRPYDFIFLDPPYKLADRLGSQLDNHLPPLLAEGGRVIVESPAGRPLALASLPVLRERRYGATNVVFYGEESA
jgi:16S rRNA (guanine966-N2)-methyltransferase